MKQAYFICGFNGFKQFNSLITEDSTKIFSGKVDYDDGPNLLRPCFHNNEQSTKPSDKGKENMLSILSPVQLDSEKDMVFSWSSLHIFDYLDNNLKTHGFINPDQLIEQHPVIGENLLVKLETAECARGFRPLPINILIKVSPVKHNSFAILENGKVHKVVLKEQGNLDDNM